MGNNLVIDLIKKGRSNNHIFNKTHFSSIEIDKMREKLKKSQDLNSTCTQRFSCNKIKKDDLICIGCIEWKLHIGKSWKSVG